MCLLCSIHVIPWEPQLRWLSQAATFLAGNAQRSWDSKEAGEWAKSQKTCQNISTKLARPCRILLFWHFSDGKFLSISVEEQCHLWTKSTISARLRASPPFSCCLNRSAGPEQGLQTRHPALVGQGSVSGTPGTFTKTLGVLPQETRVVKKQLWDPEVFSASPSYTTIFKSENAWIKWKNLN